MEIATGSFPLSRNSMSIDKRLSSSVPENTAWAPRAGYFTCPGRVLQTLGHTMLIERLVECDRKPWVSWFCAQRLQGYFTCELRKSNWAAVQI